MRKKPDSVQHLSHNMHERVILFQYFLLRRGLYGGPERSNVLQAKKVEKML